MLGRRLITIPLYIGLTVTLTALLPLLLVAALLLTPLPATRGALPSLGLILGYLWCETIGIVCTLVIWIRYPKREAFLTANFELQCWWAGALGEITKRLFHLTFEVSGEEALSGPPAIMLPRHASVADTILPMIYYAIPQKIRLRYVLKEELLIDPCLDIVGHRLPNYFVNRHGQDSEAARQGVARLVADIEANEGLLIYPEGTRFSAAKHASLRERYRNSPDQLAQLTRWSRLLPPRLGGTLAILDANPGLDIIFCAHSGFEGSSHFSNLINGSWMGACIKLKFWRVPFECIPVSTDGRREFLFTQWDRMHAAIEEMNQ